MSDHSLAIAEIKKQRDEARTNEAAARERRINWEQQVERATHEEALHRSIAEQYEASLRALGWDGDTE